MAGSRREYLTADKLKIYSTVKPSSATDAYPGPDLDDRPQFNVVIIHEDSAAGRRAKRFYDRVIRELVDESDFSLKLWNFQVLALPGIGNAAARVAAQADFVILSRSGLISDCKPALVALLDSRATGRVTVASTLDYLRKVADQKNISFYAHTSSGLSTN